LIKGKSGGFLAKLPTKERMSKCLKQFGKSVELVSVRADGDKVRTAVVKMDDQTFEVTTNLNRYSAAELGLLDANQNRVKYTGGIQSGFTTGNNPTKNDIARELTVGVENGTYNAVGFMAVFYHELGNAIAGKIYLDQYSAAKTQAERDKLTNPFAINTPATNAGDRDSGVKFERCLFGGIVSLTTGRVGNGRDW
jgi:hypothetical protein